MRGEDSPTEARVLNKYLKNIAKNQFTNMMEKTFINQIFDPIIQPVLQIFTPATEAQWEDLFRRRKGDGGVLAGANPAVPWDQDFYTLL